MIRILSAAVALAAALPAHAQDIPVEIGRPINKMCPIIKDQEAVRNITVNWKGKVIGLCCDQCVEKFMKNPAGIAGRTKADRDPYEGPKSLKSLDDALQTGKDGPYPVVLLFSDGRSGVKKWNYVLTEPVVYKELMATAYYEVPYDRKSPVAKKFEVKRFPTLLVLDARTDPPTEIERMTAPKVKDVVKALEKAEEELKKKKE